MSQETRQLILVAIFSVFMASVVYRLARKNKLSFRYTVGWLGLCAVGAFAGLLIPALTPISRLVEMTPAALIAVGVLLLLLLICIQLSISISSLQENVRKLAEHIAILDHTADRNNGSTGISGNDSE